MAEDTARAVGAGKLTPIIINGKECKLRPLTMRELGEVERECLDVYRKSYMKAYADNVQFLPKSDRSAILREKLEECAKWDVSDLPTKSVYDPLKVKIDDAVREWAIATLGILEEIDDDKLKIMIASSMDQGMIKEEEYKTVAKIDPKKVSIGYANWWISATFEGQISMIVECFRASGISKDELIEYMRDNPVALTVISSEIEKLSTPQMGN